MVLYEDDDTVAVRNHTVANRISDGLARCLATLALLLSLLALGIGWTALTRVSDVDEKVKNAATSAVESTENTVNDGANAVDRATDDNPTTTP